MSNIRAMYGAPFAPQAIMQTQAQRDFLLAETKALQAQAAALGNVGATNGSEQIMAKEDPTDQVVAIPSRDTICTSSTPTLDPWAMKQLLQEPITSEERTGLTGVYVYAAPPLDQVVPAPYAPATDRISFHYAQPDVLFASLVQDLLARVQKLEQQLAELTAKRSAKPRKPANKKGRK